MSEPEPYHKATLKRMRQKPVFFDLETMRHPDAEAWITRSEPDLTGIEAPSNWKDPDKIAVYVEDAQLKAIEKADAEYEQALKKAPLDADLGAIRAIGYRVTVDGQIVVDIVPRNRNFKPKDQTFTVETADGSDIIHEFEVHKSKNEHELVSRFWEAYRAANGETVGYNSIGFDLPYLMRRSMDLEIAPMHRVDLRRYQLKPSTDLMGILYNWYNAKGLKFVCERYGIENPNPEVDGSMVADMTDEELIHYLAGDIHMTTELWKLMYPVYLSGGRR